MRIIQDLVTALLSQKSAGQRRSSDQGFAPGQEIQGLVLGKDGLLDLIDMGRRVIRTKSQTPLPQGSRIRVRVMQPGNPVQVKLLDSQPRINDDLGLKSYLDLKASGLKTSQAINLLLNTSEKNAVMGTPRSTVESNLSGLRQILTGFAVDEDASIEKIKAMVSAFASPGKSSGPGLLRDLIERTMRLLSEEEFPNEVSSQKFHIRVPGPKKRPMEIKVFHSGHEKTGFQTKTAPDTAPNIKKPLISRTITPTGDDSRVFSLINKQEQTVALPSEMKEHGSSSLAQGKKYQHLTKGKPHLGHEEIRGGKPCQASRGTDSEKVLSSVKSKASGAHTSPEAGADEIKSSPSQKASMARISSADGAKRPLTETGRPSQTQDQAERAFSASEKSGLVPPVGKKVPAMSLDPASRQSKSSNADTIHGEEKIPGLLTEKAASGKLPYTSPEPDGSRRNSGPRLPGPVESVNPGESLHGPASQISRVLDGLKTISSHLESVQQFHPPLVPQHAHFLLIPLWFHQQEGSGHWMWWRENAGEGQEGREHSEHLFFDLDLRSLGPVKIHILSGSLGLAITLWARESVLRHFRAQLEPLLTTLNSMGLKIDSAELFPLEVMDPDAIDFASSQIQGGESKTGFHKVT